MYRLLLTAPLLATALIGAGAPPVSPAQPVDVSFVSSDGVELAGDVLLPAGSGPFPGIVVIHGSGEVDRHQPWARAFADGLVERGFAVLIPDKRGSGASGGSWLEASFEQLADDAIAAAETLATVDAVRPARVGVLGLSQGGHIAPAAAARSGRVAFVVDAVGSTVPITEQVIDEVEKMARRAGFTPEQIERVNDVHRLGIEYALRGEGWERYRQALDAALDGDLAGTGVVEGFPTEESSPVWAWARVVGPFDPIPYWRQVEVPTLFLFGGQDTQIYSVESIQRLDEALADRPDFDYTVLLMGSAGHPLLDDSGNSLRTDMLDLVRDWFDARVAER